MMGTVSHVQSGLQVRTAHSYSSRPASIALHTVPGSHSGCCHCRPYHARIQHRQALPDEQDEFQARGPQGSVRWALFTLSAVGFVAVGTAVFGAVNGGISDFLQSRVAVKKDFVPYQERRNIEEDPDKENASYQQKLQASQQALDPDFLDLLPGKAQP